MRVILTIVLIGLGGELYCQSYLPLIGETKQWTHYCVGMELSISSARYVVQEDTVITGELYKSIYHTDSAGTFIYYQKALREDTLGKVYAQRYGDTTEYLYYDFSLEQYDSIVVYAWGTPQLHTVDTVYNLMIYGSNRKIIRFNELTGAGSPYIWIEGIGSLIGLLYDELMWADQSCHLLCYEELGVSYQIDSAYNICWVYSVDIDERYNESEFRSYPNPAKTTVHFSSDNGKHAIVYSITGHKENVSIVNDIIDVSHLPNGIYFLRVGEETKKFVISR